MAKTLIVDNDIHGRFKKVCVETSTTMADATAEALAFWIALVAMHEPVPVAEALRQLFKPQELGEIIALLDEKVKR